MGGQCAENSKNKVMLSTLKPVGIQKVWIELDARTS